MRKAHTQKIRAPEYTKQPRCNIKIMREGRATDAQTLFDAFEIKYFDKGAGCRIERKKRPVKELARK